jgi:hypothetical protein
VLQAAKELARRDGTTAGKVLSDLARHALRQPPGPAAGAEDEAVCGFRPFPSRGGLVTNDVIDRLREEPGD